MKNRSLRTTLASVMAGVALAGVGPAAMAQAAADVASLYGPQPPADAAYLRVLNASTQPVKVVYTGGGPVQTLAPRAVTRYAVLRPGEPLSVNLDGHSLPRSDSGSAKAVAGDYVTVAVLHDAHGWHASAIAARGDRIDGLKATLHAYNFAANCGANIGIAGAGTTVFGNLAEGNTAARAINPVTASLVGQCGSATSAAVALPQLAAGEGYSLFVLGDAANPMLAGARDALAWPPGARQANP
ncbi:alginate O-acetyltransferase AlgF [Paraburkholderia ferrariae]|uniref:alginate O-acetyltransferase AlgF n=1 Tax=Paraburkholderia ferrariae TaxID=386056 RepID=UPI000A074815|nr:alginate O-acetyltransferase AlgF [Paraburkholderia ferrariae]